MDKIFEINCKVYLLENIIFNESQFELSKLINNFLCKDSQYKEFHLSKNFKNYCFCNLYPFENDKVYKKGKIYSFKFRTIDFKLYEYFLKNFQNEYNEKFKIIIGEKKIITKDLLEKIYSLTPIIIKNDSYWKDIMNLNQFEKRIIENTNKKYNYFTHNDIDRNFKFYNYLKFDNLKPISFKIKNINLLGDKLTFILNTDKLSQDIGFLLLGIGIGENNSYGAGFLGYKYLK